ncbi:MAG: hypothetical protein HY216_01985 [Candidatus Rokubacteria bacterium]|nr:hypothetical protein [Candidatus Rokubacteria bacterium]
MKRRIVRWLTIFAFVDLAAVAWGAGSGDWPLILLAGAAIVIAIMPRRGPAPRPMPLRKSGRPAALRKDPR